MIYDLSLKAVGLVAGGILVAAHGAGLLFAPGLFARLRAFPRSRAAGIVLTVVATVWSFWLVATMDLGEFSRLRVPLIVLVPVAGVLCIRFVDEFLSVRMLGAVLLLAAAPLLEAAFFKPPATRLLLVILAYAWAIKGMIWIGMPYVLRDQIGWVTARPGVWKAAMIAGIAYGAAVLACAIAYY